VIAHRTLPDANKLSVLASIILLAYALARFVNIPATDVELSLPGVLINFQLNIRTIVAFLVAGITASGADWLIRQHPRLQSRWTVQHWILPAVTAWVIGLPVFQLPLGYLWWLWFIVGGGLLMMVLVAEYITIDPEDTRQPMATAGLTAVAYALFLILSITLREAGVRLFLIVPALTMAGGAISLRTLHLRLYGRWALLQSGLITLILSQWTSALYYLPISPISFSLILAGVAYGLTGFMANLALGISVRRSILEPGVIFLLFLFTSIVIRS